MMLCQTATGMEKRYFVDFKIHKVYDIHLLQKLLNVPIKRQRTSPLKFRDTGVPSQSKGKREKTLTIAIVPSLA